MSSHNNGGKTDYYDVPVKITTFEELFELKEYDELQELLFLLILSWSIPKTIESALIVAKTIKNKEHETLIISDLPSFEEDINGTYSDFLDVKKFKFKDMIKIPAERCNDFIDAFDLRFNTGEAFKALFCLNQGRHDGTDKEREMNKIIYYLERELYRLDHVSKENINEQRYNEI